MLHPDTELRFINEQVGYGVVATRTIPKGTITWVMDDLDRVFSPPDVAKMSDPYRHIIDRYTFRDNRGNYILCWDHARFVNHSFHANCISTAYDFELAVRDIEAGEELTDDYGYLNIDEPFEALPEKGTRRRLVMPDDLLRYHRQWDRKLEQAFARFERVEQPLAAVMPAATLVKAREIATGRVRMDSILTCYWSRGQNGTAVADLPEGRLRR
jgi:hypothetical protein